MLGGFIMSDLRTDSVEQKKEIQFVCGNAGS